MLTQNFAQSPVFQNFFAPNSANRAWSVAGQWHSNIQSAPNLAGLANLRQAHQQLAAGWQSFGDGQVRVAVIDDFVAESNGFNHGQNIDQIITTGGAVVAGQNSSSNPNIQTVRFEIDNGGNRNGNIAVALNLIAQRAAQGEQFDAVNISQQDFAQSGDTQAVNQAVQNLQQNFGIPVVVAAGNNGAESRNQLANGAAFVVENSSLGQEQRASTSGVGNIRAEGEFTSQATANVTARVAQMREQGYSFQQIQDALIAESHQEGGSLDRPDLNQAPSTNNNPESRVNPQASPQQAQNQWVDHTIKSGETIWELVVKQGGSTLAEFQKMNPDVNLDLYHPGTVVKIPPKRESAPATSNTTPAASAPPQSPQQSQQTNRPTGGGGFMTFR